MRLFRLGVDLFIAAICAGLVAGFLSGILMTFATVGLAAFFTPATLFIGMFGAAYALMFAAPVAFLLGAVLWKLRLDHWVIWAGVGALTGLIFYLVMWYSPDGSLAAMTIPLAAAQLVAGACTALVFRVTMQTLRANADDS